MDGREAGNHMTDPGATKRSDAVAVHVAYGLASMSAQLLEKALVSTLALLETDGCGASQAEFDAVFYRCDRKTLGALIKSIGTRLALPADAEALLADALKKRNFLAHHFFAARASAIQVASGRVAMIEELEVFAKLFQRVQEEVSAPWARLLAKRGLTPEDLDKRADAMLKAYIEDLGQ